MWRSGGLADRRVGTSIQLGTLIWLTLLLAKATAAELPAIRSGPGNEIPSCVRPAELISFVSNRNRKLDPPRKINPRFLPVAGLYRRIGRCVQKVHGNCQAIRWDFAFFQMLIETNYLTFRTADGGPGGASPDDNNFAGIGATEEGKPGEKFKDVEMGVLAHLQHVLMYSGQKILRPIAHRTRAVEAFIITKMRDLGRAATFSDLAALWTGTDQDAYAEDIQGTATTFALLHCPKARLRKW